jgi:hypothetical protein
MKELSLEEKIKTYLDGRTQSSIVKKMQSRGILITDVMFTRKKKGIAKFNEEEIDELRKLLGLEIVY